MSALELVHSSVYLASLILCGVNAFAESVQVANQRGPTGLPLPLVVLVGPLCTNDAAVQQILRARSVEAWAAGPRVALIDLHVREQRLMENSLGALSLLLASGALKREWQEGQLAFIPSGSGSDAMRYQSISQGDGLLAAARLGQWWRAMSLPAAIAVCRVRVGVQ